MFFPENMTEYPITIPSGFIGYVAFANENQELKPPP